MQAYCRLQELSELASLDTAKYVGQVVLLLFAMHMAL